MNTNNDGHIVAKLGSKEANGNNSGPNLGGSPEDVEGRASNGHICFGIQE